MKRKLSTRELIKKILGILLPIFSVSFLLGTTALIIIVMKGYSLDITKRVIIKTGVLNIETNPADAEIYVSDKYYGKSNRAIPNLQTGSYLVKIIKNGYFPYQRQVDINHGLASPITVPLIRDIAAVKMEEHTNILLSNNGIAGYFILSKKSSLNSPTPTPTTTATASIEYTIRHLISSKPLFDDPQPSLDEKMTITALPTTTITSLAVSPLGKSILIESQDSNKAVSIALVPFKNGSTVNLNLANNNVLSFYKQDKSITIKWASNSDYLLIESAKQLISYNVKTGSRVILVEKSELGNDKTVAWDTSDEGIVVLKKVEGSTAPNYEITVIAYNGTPKAVSLPVILFNNTPKTIWDLSTNNEAIFTIVTDKETYLIGKLYTAKTGEYEITLANEKIGETPIEQLQEEFSMIKISDEPITSKPLINTIGHSLVFIENSGKQISYYAYNKRTADLLTTLGKTVVTKDENTIDSINLFASGHYIAYKIKSDLYVTDSHSQNKYLIATDLLEYDINQTGTTLSFIDSQKNLLFRLLR